MLNQIILVGRLTCDVAVHKTEKGGKVATVSLAIPRSFKNSEGVYETDFVDCIVFDTVAENTAEYCSKGDVVGVKGRIQTRKFETEDEKVRQVTEVIGEKVTFLSSKKHEEDSSNKANE